MELENNNEKDNYEAYETNIKDDLKALLDKYGGNFSWNNGNVFVQFIATKANILKYKLDDKDLDKKIIFLYKLVDDASYVAGFMGEHEASQDAITKILDKLLCYDIDKFISIMNQLKTINFSHNNIDKKTINDKLGIQQELPTNIPIDDYIEKLISFNKEYKISKIHLKIANLIKSKQGLTKCLDYCEETIKQEYHPDNFYDDDNYDVLLKYYLDLLEKKQKYQRLLDILEYLLALYNDTDALYVDNIKYYEKYLEITKKLNLEEKYQEKLLEFYKKVPSLDKFKELKSLLKLDKNSPLYQELIDAPKKYEFLLETYASICINEGLFTEAFEAIKDNIGLLTLYAKDLETYYQEEMKIIYTKYFKLIVNEAKNRNDYKKVFKQLLLLKDLKIKDTIYPEITKYIKENFKKKPAFIEELKQFSRKIKVYK